MKKINLTSLFLLVMIVSYGQADLGIGIVAIKFSDKTVLNFYESPTGNKPVRIIKFFEDNETESWDIKNLDKQKEWLKPEALNLDSYAFTFRCKNVKDNWYNVIVNNETGKALWLEKRECINLMSWEGYLKDIFGLARLSDYPQKIRNSPSDKAEEIKYLGNDLFQVKSMQGDWIEVSTLSSDEVKSGWIKWREGSKLIIDYFFEG